jgi:hypothetical protein
MVFAAIKKSERPTKLKERKKEGEGGRGGNR